MSANLFTVTYKLFANTGEVSVVCTHYKIIHDYFRINNCVGEGWQDIPTIKAYHLCGSRDEGYKVIKLNAEDLEYICFSSHTWD